MLSLLVEIEPHLKRSGQQQMLFETLLVRCALLDRTVSIEELLRGGGEGASPSARGGAAGGGGGGSGVERAPMRAAAPSAPPVAREPAPSQRLSGPAAEAVPTRPPAAVRERPPGNAPSVAVADAPPAKPASMPLEINRLVEHWEGIVDGVVRDGRALLAAALGHATPTAVTASGVVTLTVDDAAQAELIVQQESAILAAVRRRFETVSRLNVHAADADAAPRRLSEGAVKADRMAMLRKQSPLLAAAADALDLELLD